MKENQDYLKTENQVVSEEEIKQYVLGLFYNSKHTSLIKNLVNFQAMNKYLVLAHDQEELKNLGNIVAKHKKIPFSEILDYYELHLKKALENQPTIKKHTNVILHVFGHFSQKLEEHEKKIFLDLLQNYKEEKIPLGKLLAKIHPIIFRFDNMYLASQTYFLLYSNIESGVFSKIKTD